MPRLTVKDIESLQPKKRGGRPMKKIKKKPVVRKPRTKKIYIYEESEESESETELKYVCHVCKTDVKMSEKQLKRHFKKDHEGKRLCNMKFHKDDAVKCDLCPKTFSSLKCLKEHMETHIDEFNCDSCNISFKKVLDYTLHLRLHDSEELFKCPLCEFKTDSINDITSHVNDLHKHKYKYKCRQCGKGFHVISWFKEHKYYHTDEKPFECDICLIGFTYSRYLEEHKNKMHQDDAPETDVPKLFECVICKKTYQHKTSLTMHMNSHAGKFVICDVCGKTLSSKEKLKYHMRIHTGYKPFSCTYCGKCFVRKTLLIEHERIHTGEKPYTCEYCSKGFSQRSSLVIHIRGHTGEKPYVCHICNKGFAARAILNVHFKSCKGMV